MTATAEQARISPTGLRHEDEDRSADRTRVFRARYRHRRWLLLWLLIGPGMLAMLGENDGPSMLSYATTGATYGLGTFLPFTLLTFAMAVVCQEMCMRIGSVTHRGYGELVLQRFGRVWGYFNAGDLVVTNLVTLVAEFVAIRVGLAYFGLSAGVAAALGLVLVLFTISGGRYWRWERVVLGMAVFNGLFLVAAIAARPDWGNVGHALVTASPFPHGSLRTLLLLVASTIGATVTPWMIFFQQSASADKGLTPDDVRFGRLDTIAGAVLAALFGCGAMIAGAVLATHGGLGIRGLLCGGLPGRARACVRPRPGHAVCTGSDRGRRGGRPYHLGQHRLRRGRVARDAAQHELPHAQRAVFYGANLGAAAIAAAIILIPGAPLLSIALNANVLATVLLPVALVFVILLANDRELMGRFTNGRMHNWVAGAVVLVVSLSGTAYAIVAFLETLHVL